MLQSKVLTSMGETDARVWVPTPESVGGGFIRHITHVICQRSRFICEGSYFICGRSRFISEGSRLICRFFHFIRGIFYFICGR